MTGGPHRLLPAMAPSATAWCSDLDTRPARVLAVVVDPSSDLLGIKPQQVPPLDERDSPLVHQPSDMANLDAEDVGNVHDRDEPYEGLRVIGSGGGGHLGSSFAGCHT